MTKIIPLHLEVTTFFCDYCDAEYEGNYTLNNIDTFVCEDCIAIDREEEE